jgi:CheY-like chemotaxis protein
LARQELAQAAPRIIHNLQESFDALPHARNALDRKLRLENLYRRVHFVTGLGGLAECPALAQMASAFEAMLFAMMDKLPDLPPTLEWTTATAVEFLQQLLRRPIEVPTSTQHDPSCLVVDDDRLTNRLVISALRNAHLQARGTDSPELALQWLQEKHYDLILLDVEMPGIDGLELGKRIRALPGYENTPVIYVTLHSDFGTRLKTVLSGGNDLIAKPILPTELAVKAVMHLLKSQVPGNEPG